MKPIFKNKAISIKYKLPDDYTVCNVWFVSRNIKEIYNNKDINYIFIPKAGNYSKPAFQMLPAYEWGSDDHIFFLDENVVSHWYYATEN